MIADMISTKCKATKTNGQPCDGYAQGTNGYCWAHDPDRKAEADAARKLGGLHRQTTHGGDTANVPGHVRSLADVLDVLDYTLAEALEMENGEKRNRLLISLAAEYSATIRANNTEDRLKSVERALKARR